jgi:hypothetical protein
LQQQVRFLGNRTDIPQILSASDVFVLPSLYEGMPLAAIEAAAMGKPVVATDVDGTREVLVDGLTGLLACPANAASLGQSILQLLGSNGLPKIGRAARERALSHFDVSHSTTETATQFRQAQATHTRRPTILHVEAATTYGGSVRALENYLRSCSPGRFRNLVCLYTPLAAASRLAAAADGVWVIPVTSGSGGGWLRRARSLGRQLLASLKLTQLILREHVDLVRLNNASWRVCSPAVAE